MTLSRTEFIISAGNITQKFLISCERLFSFISRVLFKACCCTRAGEYILLFFFYFIFFFFFVAEFCVFLLILKNFTRYADPIRVDYFSHYLSPFVYLDVYSLVFYFNSIKFDARPNVTAVSILRGQFGHGIEVTFDSNNFFTLLSDLRKFV